MITKDIARLIHNCYTEIEQGEKMIQELKSKVNEKGEIELKDYWGNDRTIEMHIPSSNNGATIKKVPFELAITVISIHKQEQEIELKRLNQIAKLQLD